MRARRRPGRPTAMPSAAGHGKQPAAAAAPAVSRTRRDAAAGRRLPARAARMRRAQRAPRGWRAAVPPRPAPPRRTPLRSSPPAGGRHGAAPGREGEHRLWQAQPTLCSVLLLQDVAQQDGLLIAHGSPRLPSLPPRCSTACRTAAMLGASAAGRAQRRFLSAKQPAQAHGSGRLLLPGACPPT